MTECITFADLARNLGRRAPDLAQHLLGDPTSRTARQWRYRNKGSLAIIMAGPEAGCWFDHDPPAGARRGGDAIDLIAHCEGSSLREAYARGLQFLGETSNKSVSPSINTQTPLERLEAAARVWAEGRPIAGTIAEKYLACRGITCCLTADLRFHPRCWNKESQTHLPAMLALLRDIASDEGCGVHRTWLARDGSSKANIQTPKKMLGRAKGAAIKLCPDADVVHGLGIVEGIETGLSLMSIGWSAVWAVGSAGAIGAFPVLGGVEELTVFADNDPSEAGLRQARVCANRWRAAGRETSITIPGTRGNDWNDVLRSSAA